MWEESKHDVYENVNTPCGSRRKKVRSGRTGGFYSYGVGENGSRTFPTRSLCTPESLKLGALAGITLDTTRLHGQELNKRLDLCPYSRT